MSYLPMSRLEAIQSKSKFYAAARPCRLGHMGRRRTDSRACVECYEMAKASNSAIASVGREGVSAIVAAMERVVREQGFKAAAAAEPTCLSFAGLLVSGADMTLLGEVLSAFGSMTPEQMRTALALAPITADGRVIMTAAGRSVGREYVISIPPGDAINMQLAEVLR